MPGYVLSPEAQTSLNGIQSYSLANFGKRRTIIYLKQLRERMKDLAVNPSSGKTRDDIKAGFYSSFVGSHTIYYRISGTHIEIIDVLHQRMEPTRRL
jgi:toxin ParE1/3/4